MNVVRQRPFVFTVLWAGFLLAISFMEAPLKFQAASVTVPIGLEIGYLVFHALNGIEWSLFLIILYSTLGRTSDRCRQLTIAIGIWLLLQTMLLYTALDSRTLAIINGDTVPEAPYHIIYILMEVVKLGGLLYLAHLQINRFAEEVAS